MCLCGAWVGSLTRRALSRRATRVVGRVTNAKRCLRRWSISDSYDTVRPTMRFRRTLVPCALGVLWVLALLSAAPPSRACAQQTGSVAQAAPDASRDGEARGLFQAGEQAFRGGHYADALDYFKRAHALSGRAALLYNVGISADRLRRDDEAVEAFQRYLRESAPDALNRAEVDSRLRALLDARAQRATVSTPPVATTPTTTPVTATAAAVTPATTTVTRPVAATTPTVAAVTPTVATSANVEPARLDATHGPTDTDAPAADEQHGGGRLFTWLALGAGVAAGVGGAVVGLLVQSDYDKLVTDCAAKGGCTQAEVDDASLGMRVTLTNILFAVGGAAALTGVVLFFVEGGDDGPEDVRVAAGVGLGGLVVRGSF